MTVNAICGWLLLRHCPDDIGVVLRSCFYRCAMSKKSVSNSALTLLLFHQTCSAEAGEDGGVLADWLNDKDKQANQHTGHHRMGARCGKAGSRGGGGGGQLLSTQGHLHKLELEVVLEGVGSDEAQFARCDGAGEEEKKQDRHSEEKEKGCCLLVFFTGCIYELKGMMKLYSQVLQLSVVNKISAC